MRHAAVDEFPEHNGWLSRRSPTVSMEARPRATGSIGWLLRYRDRKKFNQTAKYASTSFAVGVDAASAGFRRGIPLMMRIAALRLDARRWSPRAPLVAGSPLAKRPAPLVTCPMPYTVEGHECGADGAEWHARSCLRDRIFSQAMTL
jgi:hypothetical protein